MAAFSGSHANDLGRLVGGESKKEREAVPGVNRGGHNPRITDNLGGSSAVDVFASIVAACVDGVSIVLEVQVVNDGNNECSVLSVLEVTEEATFVVVDVLEDVLPCGERRTVKVEEDEVSSLEVDCRVVGKADSRALGERGVGVRPHDVGAVWDSLFDEVAVEEPQVSGDVESVDQVGIGQLVINLVDVS